MQPLARLTNKQILLGITGGIAAYKAAELVRRLQDAGATVQVIMTQGAQAFITPLTLQALSGHKVHTELLDAEAEAGMGHIELARWADLILVAPASADFIARLAQGLGNDLLSTVCLASKSPIALAPAMNQGMWANAGTQNNIQTLQQRGIHLFGPASGSQACGDVGFGRMLEADQLCQAAAELFESGLLSGKTVVITAGPTREALDPVRYISNKSSGKMGYALAQAAVEAGAKTILISGPTALGAPERVSMVNVESARQMHEAALTAASKADIFIGAAAVADYRAEDIATQKIKKTTESDTLTLTLVKNPDIIASVAALPSPPFMVGFAAETQNIVTYAEDKLVRKKLHMVIANDVSNQSIGFDAEDNAVTIVEGSGNQMLTQRNKSQLARDIIALIAKRLG